MNHQKDTEKIGRHSYGHIDASLSNTLDNKPLYDFANKKTEKLVTALYMVTDCMDSDDALKAKLRALGVLLLSDMYKLSTLSPIDKDSHIVVSKSRVHELRSFVDIASTIGFISEMNAAILNREFGLLVEELASYQSKDNHFAFTLDKEMFDVRKDDTTSDQGANPIKDISGGKKTLSSMSFINNLNSQISTISPIKKLTTTDSNPLAKQHRIERILALIKDKKEISIKDISYAFTDCSEKTIQRELNSLVSKGQIKKIGAKRWSRYQAIK